MYKNLIVYALCRCFVWPLVAPGAYGVGSCKRCGERPGTPLHPDIGKEEAHEVFKERNGHYPEPIG